MSPNLLEVPAPVVRDVIALRRDFHAHPELGFEEVRTAGVVAERLNALGYEVRTGVGQTGVLGVLRAKRPGKTILLRADMDCLPIHEHSGVEFASTNPGKMHACGHDGHTAMLLGAAQLIMERRDLLHGTIVLCFQPAEEGKGGARAMIEDGALDEVDRVYGLHLTSLYPTGQVLVRPGPVMASSDSIDVTIRGRGGHGAAPHQTVDPILTSAYFICQVQSVVSRNVDPTEPSVVTIGAVHGGTIHNVIPDHVELLGTVRAYSEAERAAMKPRIERVLSGCCEAQGAAYDYRYIDRYPVTVNDAHEAAYVRDLALRTVGEKRLGDLSQTMGAEDFSFMLQRKPGCFFFIGSQCDEKTAVAHHNARFAIDERCLVTGVQMMTALALDAPQRA
jgi:amidohydrolase